MPPTRLNGPTLLFGRLELAKSKIEISQNFVAFSEYMNFTYETSMSFTTFEKNIGICNSYEL